MRLAILLNNFNGGGGERTTVLLANALAQEGSDVTIVAVSGAGPCRDLVRPDVPVVVLGSGRALWSLPGLLRTLASLKPDALLASMVIANTLAALAGLVFRRTPIVAVEHGDMNELYHVDRGRLAARIGYLLAPWVYGRLDRIVCVDRTTLASVAAFTRRKDLALTVLPNVAIDADADQRLEGAVAHPFPDGPVPVVLNVGRMAEQKDQALLLEAFAALVARRPARLVILGDGELRSRLEAKREALGLSAHVDFPGFRDPFPFYARSACLALTSRWEALPTTIIEALYCGCPVATTPASMGTLELVGFGTLGAIASSRSPAAIADAIETALDRAWDREALRVQGRRFAGPAVAGLYLAEIASARRAREARR